MRNISVHALYLAYKQRRCKAIATYVTLKALNGFVIRVALSLALLSGCQNDSHTVSGNRYTPTWSVVYDQSTSLLVADAAALSSYNSGEYYQCMSVQNALAERADKKSCYNDTEQYQYTLTRLVAAEAFRIATEKSEWQLYRRSAPFIYERTIAIPKEPDYFRLTYDRNSPSDENIVAHITIPNPSNALLVEEGQSVSDTSTINLSWEVDSEQFPLTSQSVVIRHNDCGVGADVDRSTIALDIQARSTSIEVGSLPQPSNASVQSCPYTLQLALITQQQDSVHYVLTTLSKIYPFTVEFNSEQPQ